ncbi:ubiquinol-cytochrome c reductase cytochrome b subunit [Kineosporia rhizophila]|uniref:cytochrome bc1 complex cytochrome b subunit n=1 Tax=Kineosporia rhizophila TaxID=84633 RepID=UPI001E5212C3|nr:ubiquinol-cytochrome c reductase cytochrome b subunit [Kineosporia rhizophila]MCE0538297.1 ubiquinol-cytochrome c reductase cytochrome b subunit [Kineosporia rhizophila]
MSTTSPLEKAGATTGNWLDERVGASKVVRGFSRKIFPDHWSFMLGEVALYSFVILLLSGTFLTFWFIPSAAETTYNGPYAPLAGQHVSEAFDSTLHISFEVRGGLLMRQVHHWAALVFVVSMIVHMFRIFFTGAFRKPREMNWVIGMLLAVLALIEGFLGYSMIDDLLSGNGLRIAQAIVLGIPVVGSYVSFFLFGGEFPGEAFIPRFFVLHVLLIPAIMLVLITVHLILVVVHKHTQYPGPGRTNNNVVGFPLFPIYTAKAGGFFFIVFGVIALMGALFQINPVWIYGPYDPSPISAGAQPDFYMGFLDGAVRIMPGFVEFEIWGHTVSPNIFIPTLVVPGLMVTPALLYPWIEQWVTGDKREHHLLDRPRNAPTRTALGVMAITAYVLLWISGGNDIIATHLHLSINDITYFLRVGVFVLPALAYVITKRICIGLQRKDREKVLHGRETGRVFRTEEGEVFELHAPLSAEDRWLLVGFDSPEPARALPATDASGVRRPGGALEKLRQKVSRFYFEDRVAPVTPAELAAAHHHGEHEEVSASGGARPEVESGH